jgi:hypothetical protein
MFAEFDKLSMIVTVAVPACAAVKVADAAPFMTVTLWLDCPLEKVPTVVANVTVVAVDGADATID